MRAIWAIVALLPLRAFAQASETAGDPASGQLVRPLTLRSSHPVIVHRTEPEYSEEARIAGIEGTVLVTGVVGPNGTARELRVTGSLGLGLDEKAMEAVEDWRFFSGAMDHPESPAPMTVEVDFLVPSRSSRWHLIQAEFHPPEGTSRPYFLSAPYPPGAGIGREAMEEARIVAMLDRQAVTTLSCDIDPQGHPVGFEVREASEPLWGKEAVAVVRNWRFKPGLKDGLPVTVPCTLKLAWGQRRLTADRISVLRAPSGSQPSAPAVSDSVVLPLIQVTRESYPEEALQAGVEGVVILSFLLGQDGKARDVVVTKSLGHGLDAKAIETVTSKRFGPIEWNGRPVSLRATVLVNFRLSGVGPVSSQSHP